MIYADDDLTKIYDVAANIGLAHDTVKELVVRAQVKEIKAAALVSFIRDFRLVITSNMEAYKLPIDEQALAIFDVYFS